MGNILKKIDLYFLLISFLVSLYLLNVPVFGIEKILQQALPPILATIAADSFLYFLIHKKWQFKLVSVISGLIIGLVAQFGEQAWKLALIGTLAMAGKALVTVHGRHIFNPAGSGLLLGMILLSSYPAWWGGSENTWIFLIWIPILLYRLNKWAIIAAFLLPLAVILGPNILISGSLLFFTSVMLIEPMTSPQNLELSIIYGLIVAITYLILTRIGGVVDPLIVSLLVGNFFNRVVFSPDTT